MSDPRWENVREDWLPNDGFRDVFIADDTEEDWRKVASWILSRPEWSTTYTEDGEHHAVRPDCAHVQLTESSVRGRVVRREHVRRKRVEGSSIRGSLVRSFSLMNER